MRKKFRLLLIVVLACGLLGTAAMEYLNRVVLPAKGKAWAETSLSGFLGRKTSIRSIRVHPWHGIVVEGITVDEDARWGQAPFLEIDRVSGQILYLPFFKNREILIPSLQISQPKIQIHQNAEGVWNIENLRFSSAGTGRQSGKFRLLVPKVLFKNSKLELILEKANPPFRVRFVSLDAELSVSPPSKIRWSLTTRLASGSPNKLEIDGSYNLQTHMISLKNRSVLDLKSIRPILPAEIARTIADLQGAAVLEISASGPRRGPFSVKGSLGSDSVGWKIALPRPIEWKDRSIESLSGKGSLLISVNGQWPQPPGLPLFSGWLGGAEIQRMSVQPLPVVGELKDVSGHIDFSPDGIRTERITASDPNGLVFIASGSLSNDPKKSFALQCRTSGSAMQIAKFFQEKEAAFLAFNPSGIVEAALTAEGSLHPKFSFQPIVLGTIKSGSADIPGLGQLTDMSGTFHLQPDLLTVSKWKGVCQEKPFEFEGILVGFARPEIEARLSWDRLQAESRFAIEGENIFVDDFSGRYGGGIFHLSGKLGTGKGFPSSLYGEISVDAEELASLFPSVPEWLKKNPLQGKISSKWLVEGPLLKPASCNLGLKTTSPALTAYGVPLQQVNLKMEAEPDRPVFWSGTAILAGGQISTAGSVDAQKENGPWIGRLAAENVELALLSRDLRWKTENLSGRLALQFEGDGKSSGFDSLQGKGKIEIRGGRIAELPLLGGFAEMIRLPTLRTIVLHEAEGTFGVKDGRIITKDLELRAPEMALHIAGTGGFLEGIESPINLKILPTLSPELIPEETRSKLGKMLAKGTSYFIGEVRVTGTWKNPVKKFVAKPITQILNEQLFNLQDFLKDLF